jgi:hypothetical protein
MKENPRSESAGEAGNQQRHGLISPPASTAQHPKPHVCRAVAPPLPCYGSDTVTAIIELVALHLRRTIPALSHLTLGDFDEALADLRPQIGKLLDMEIREALLDAREIDDA